MQARLRPLIVVSVILASIALTPAFCGFVRYARSQDAPAVSPWPLTGQEILLEIADPRGTLSPGIYAFDPSTLTPGIGGMPDDPDASLRLLVKQGQRPVWSPHHKRFAYLFNGQLWLADLTGNKVAVSPAPPERYLKPDKGAVSWAWDGTVFYSLHSSGWGSKVHIGSRMEEFPLKDLQVEFPMIFSNNFFPVVPLKHRIGVGVEKKWSDTLTTNEATFSPDGRYIATEVYSSAPMDVKRDESRIQVYRLYSGTGDETKDKPKFKEAQEWFATFGGYSFPYGSGRRLTTNNEESVTELRPRWSPNGQWIAYTLLDVKKEVMVPVVVRADGSTPIRLVTAKEEGFMGPLLSKEWTPVTGGEAPLRTGPAWDTKTWGHVQRVAEEWSSDGKYLWMTQGTDGLFVAKQENDKWSMRQIAWPKTGGFGLRSWAFNGPWAAWVEDTGDARRIYELNVLNIESNESKSVRLRPTLEVCWMDW